MGFGVLFCGYLIAFLLSLNPFAALTRLIGYAICLAALIRLHRHNRWFAFTHAVCYPMIIFALVGTASELCGRLMGDGAPAALTSAAGVLEHGLGVLILLFHLFLLLAIFTIAQDTGLEDIAKGARRRMALFAAYAVLYLIWLLPVGLEASYMATLGIVIMAMQLLWTLLDLVLIFRCYMWICLEGDEEMLRRPSRFAFINRFHEKLDAKNEKAMAEAVEYARAKREARIAAKMPAKGKHKQKKKKKR